MLTFFNFLTHLVIIGGCIGLIVATIKLIGDTRSVQQQTLRIIACVVGVFIYVGARAVGMSIPELILQAESVTAPVSIGAVGFIFPALTGTAAAWILTKALKNNGNISVRVVILVMSFLVFMFGDVYAAAFTTTVRSGEFNNTLLPNLLFVLSLGLYVILKHDPDDDRSTY